ncbi:Hypothetical protein NTJ_06703 [Nesidiocoris tenuis]|uniref:Uncharacterized protein n=1 Tax=Nesidiocoris tenuis TaxID=355587 RepID=A0ABN7ANU3_9HEMI|nr:Hypothetical protein NTJ_06703 [Nesidiocoris tenuis]
MAGYFSAVLVLWTVVAASFCEEEVLITPKPKSIISIKSEPLTFQQADYSKDGSFEQQYRLAHFNHLGVNPYNRLTFDAYNRQAFNPYFNHAVPTIYGFNSGIPGFGLSHHSYGLNIFDAGDSYDKNWYPGALPPFY